MTPAPLAPLYSCARYPAARFVVTVTTTTINVYDLNVSADRPIMFDILADAQAFVAAHVRAGEYANLIGLDGKAVQL